ncbi:MAG: rhodanese-like domain-containing protein [Candidatus Promineifilaceae bacterium]|nr:rhodanese-like domain-containing protein [Candidatus Promineifilaceae bacterium]
MKKGYLIVGLLLMLLLAACGGSEVATAPQEAAIDLAALPPEVDVDTVAEIADREEVFLLDVREQWEYDEAHIPGVYLLPMNEVPARLNEIPTDQTVIVTCRTGNRSGQVTNYLRNQGFSNVHNMAGGIVDWQAEGYPVE